MHPTTLLIHQQISKTTSQLRNWAQQVTRMTRLNDAIQLAAHKPTPGILVRSMPVLWMSEKNQAEKTVEQHLARLIKQADAQTLLQTQHKLQGHWPKLYIQAQERIKCSQMPQPASSHHTTPLQHPTTQ
jgi:hypothetical protein